MFGKKRAPWPWIAAIIGLGSTGCMKNTYATGLNYGGGAYTQQASFYLWGLVGEHTVDLNQVCPGGAAWFQNYRSFGDSLIGLVTCGIYQPVTIEVRCASGQAFLAVPDPQEGVTWFYQLDKQGQPMVPVADACAEGAR